MAILNAYADVGPLALPTLVTVASFVLFVKMTIAVSDVAVLIDDCHLKC